MYIFIFILVLVLYMIIGGVAKCTGSNYNPLEEGDTEWQYKHTDRM